MEANDVMPGSAEDFGDLKKVSWVEFLPRRKKVDFRGSRGQTCSFRWGAARGGGGGGRWKSQHRKIAYHSPYVEKPFSSKVIKSFLPELRSRKVFRISGFLCYLYASYEYSLSRFFFFCRKRESFQHEGNTRRTTFPVWLRKKQLL